MKRIIDKQPMIEREQALPGRSEPLSVPPLHFVSGNRMLADHTFDDQSTGGQSVPSLHCPTGMVVAMFGLGCFWGAERKFWQLPGVYLTAVGYAAGYTPNPSYDEVCSWRTGHNEVVQVIYDPTKIAYDDLLMVFWQSHNPTEGMRQGNDSGTQYRSGIYTYSEAQSRAATASKEHYQQQLLNRGFGVITTEIVTAPVFYFAEPYHQQYLAKNPAGYCGLGGTGVPFGG